MSVNFIYRILSSVHITPVALTICGKRMNRETRVYKKIDLNNDDKNEDIVINEENEF